MRRRRRRRRDAPSRPAEIADCPVWEDFLDYALAGKRENIDFLQRYCGYCCTGVTMEEFPLYLVGQPGTGKGTFTKTFAGVLGNYAQSVPISMFTEAAWHAEYYRATLAGYRLILASEPEKDSFWSEGFVNEVTGSDRLNGRHPAGRPFTFDPTHKLLLQGPVLPDLKGVLRPHPDRAGKAERAAAQLQRLGCPQRRAHDELFPISRRRRKLPRQDRPQPEIRRDQMGLRSVPEIEQRRPVGARALNRDGQRRSLCP